MLYEIGVLVGAPVLRSVAGWLENALEDKQISAFELGELGATIFRMGIIGFGLYLGLDLEPFAAAGSALLVDFLLSALKKR